MRSRNTTPSNVIPLSPDKNMTFQQLKANQRAELLKARLGQIVIDDCGDVYKYTGAAWEPIREQALNREAVELFKSHQSTFSKVAISSVVDTLKIIIPVIGLERSGIIGFSNGVFDINRQTFEPHAPENWLTAVSNIEYQEPDKNQPFEQQAPNFFKWLDHASGGSKAKQCAIEAALYMVLANRYDWQLFLEATGEGGSGKSVFSKIASLLVDDSHVAASTTQALDDDVKRAPLVGARLITLPDQPKYIGDGSGIKAITGGDNVLINPKYKAPFSTEIKAVILATNNQPMIFTERNGGISRRRVILSFSRSVPDNERDPQMVDKIRAEMPSVVSYLFRQFSAPAKAKAALVAQRDSAEAMEIRKETDHVLSFVGWLVFGDAPTGMMLGANTLTKTNVRKFVYHLYLAYADYYGHKPLAPLSLAKSLKQSAKELGERYIDKKTKIGKQTNITPMETLLEMLHE